MKFKIFWASRPEIFSLVMAFFLFVIGVACLVASVWGFVMGSIAGSFTDPYELIPMFVVGVVTTGTGALALVSGWKDLQ